MVPCLHSNISVTWKIVQYFMLPSGRCSPRHREQVVSLPISMLGSSMAVACSHQWHLTLPGQDTLKRGGGISVLGMSGWRCLGASWPPVSHKLFLRSSATKGNTRVWHSRFLCLPSFWKTCTFSLKSVPCGHCNWLNCRAENKHSPGLEMEWV